MATPSKGVISGGTTTTNTSRSIPSIQPITRLRRKLRQQPSFLLRRNPSFLRSPLQGPFSPTIGPLHHQLLLLLSLSPSLQSLLAFRQRNHRLSPLPPHSSPVPFLLQARRRSPLLAQIPNLPFQIQQIHPQGPRYSSPLAFDPRHHSLARPDRSFQRQSLRFRFFSSRFSR